MQHNLGTGHRWLRVVMAVVMASLAVMAPLPLVPRALGFGSLALYMLWSAFAGHCFGMRLVGRSTCTR